MAAATAAPPWASLDPDTTGIGSGLGLVDKD
jgi:hypothetical protein